MVRSPSQPPRLIYSKILLNELQSCGDHDSQLLPMGQHMYISVWPRASLTAMGWEVTPLPAELVVGDSGRRWDPSASQAPLGLQTVKVLGKEALWDFERRREQALMMLLRIRGLAFLLVWTLGHSLIKYPSQTVAFTSCQNRLFMFLLLFSFTTLTCCFYSSLSVAFWRTSSLLLSPTLLLSLSQRKMAKKKNKIFKRNSISGN